MRFMLHRCRTPLLLVCGACALGPVLFAARPSVPQARPGRPAAATVAVQGVSLIDGTGAAPRDGVTILIRNGRIADVAPAGSVAPAADIIVNGRGLWAVPGLIDAHVHLSPTPWAEQVDRLRHVLEGGVTAVYDVAGDIRNVSDVARAAMAGEIASPTIYYCALMAGHAFFTDPRVVGASRGFAPGEAPWNREITPQTDLVTAVAAARGAGATAIKLYAALDADTVRRIADEARKQKMRLVAHATVFPAKPSDLIAAGVNMLAHAAYLVWEGSPASTEFPKRARGDFAGVPADGPVMEHVLVAMRDRDVALNPTLWIFAEGHGKDDLAPLRTPWMNLVTRRAQALGVTIAAGTDDVYDESVDPLPLLHRELEVLVSGAGLTPMQALVAATRGAAHAMGAEADRGTIADGKAADLVLLDSNPVQDIRNTRRIRYVIKDGRIVFDAAAGRAR